MDTWRRIAFVRCACAVLLLAMGVCPALESKGQPAPATRPSASGTTEADFFQGSIPYYRSLLGELYETAGTKDPRWDAPAAKFLQDMATHLAAQSVRSFYRPANLPSAEVLLKAGEDVLALGCDDPIVCYCIAELYDQLNRRLDAIKMYGRAGTRNRLVKISEVLAFRVTSRMVAWHATMDVSKGSRRVSIAAGPLSSIARRHRLRLFTDAEKPTAWHGELIEAIDALPSPDPWLRDMLAGRMHIKLAWESRGSGFANTVTEEGWKGFFNHLTLARECFVRAHKLAPELPESASDMITVAMGGSERLNENPEKWFDLAIAAQPDYRGAYSRILSALMPRWGGSLKRCLRSASSVLRSRGTIR